LFLNFSSISFRRRQKPSENAGGDMPEEVLKNLSDRFNALSMPNSTIRAISHPYDFLAANFPTYNDFYNYFADFSKSYKGEKPFAEMLYEVYHDMRDLQTIAQAMNHGARPQNIERIFRSLRTLNELTRKKFSQANTWLAQEYQTKH
jgi:hypothetical protein